MQFPQFRKIRQEFNRECIADVAAKLNEVLTDAAMEQRFAVGDKVAIAVGSRGIANLAAMVKVLAHRLKQAGAKPFIVPAMGSHGGATAEGQTEVLASLGITADSIGVPIRSSMEVIELGKTAKGATVYIDKNAWQADGIVIINRIKPHTRFKADNESGLMKMVSVGLGKEKGCSQVHAFGLFPTVVEAARLTLSKASIRLGIGIVENAYDQTAVIRAADADNLEAVDSELLKLAKTMLPSFPLNQMDLLIVKEMGKNISGTGMDVNVLGRVSLPLPNDNEVPRIERILPLSLSPESHGNALGIGLADVAPRHLVDQVDWKATYANVVAAGVLDRAKLPVVAENDSEAIQIALQSLGVSPERARIVIVRSTLAMDHLLVSTEIEHELARKPGVYPCGDCFDLEFDQHGNLSEKLLQSI